MQENSQEKESNYERGKRCLSKLNPASPARLKRDLGDIAPEMERWIMEWPYAEIYTRPQLDIKSREIATLAALTAIGDAELEMRAHITQALNVGCSRQEIIEIFMQMTAYCGFPRALNAIYFAKNLFKEMDEKTA